MTAIDLARSEDRSTAPPSPRAWMRIGLRVVLFCGVVGLLLGSIDGTRGAIIDNLVYSECIGLSIYAGYIVMRIWVVPRRRPLAVFDYVLRGVVAVPIGFVVGLNAASLLMGDPIGFAVMARTANLAIPVTIVASLCLMYYFWSSNRIADAAAASADAQRTLAEAKLKLLRAQIEPHMLFNTLANLRTLVDVDPQRAQAMIDQLIVYLRGTLAASRSASTTLEAEFAQLHVGIGNQVRIVPTTEILFFEATDKYVGVHTSDGEGLIRMSMRELLDRLDPAAFIQVHRGTVVNRVQIVTATRDESGRVSLKLRDSPRVIGVSRAFAHRFRAM